MIKKIKHSLRFKLTMLLMIIMTLTIFGSIGITLLSVKTYFVGKLKKRMINAYKSALEEIRTHQDKNGRPVFIEDSIAKGKRALARMRFIEHYGSEQQKERLAGYKKSDFPGGVVPRLK